VILRDSEFHQFRQRPTLAGLGRPHYDIALQQKPKCP
jgi:hypothetical protein